MWLDLLATLERQTDGIRRSLIVLTRERTHSELDSATPDRAAAETTAGAHGISWSDRHPCRYLDSARRLTHWIAMALVRRQPRLDWPDRGS
jgi:hypothetical protein